MFLEGYKKYSRYCNYLFFMFRWMRTGLNLVKPPISLGEPLVAGHYSFSYKPGPVLLSNEEISKSYASYLIPWNKLEGFKIHIYEEPIVGRSQSIISAEPDAGQIAQFKRDIKEAANADRKISLFIAQNTELN